jgi:hypothetical protein
LSLTLIWIKAPPEVAGDLPDMRIKGKAAAPDHKPAADLVGLYATSGAACNPHP